MHIMKCRSIIPIISTVLLIMACSETSTDNGTEQSATEEVRAESSQAPAAKKSARNTGAEYWERLEMRPLRDAQGTVVAELPMPTTWKVHEQRKQGDPTFSGPNGLRISDYVGNSFFYVSDPTTQQYYYQSGVNLRYMPGVNQVIEQDVKPWLQANQLTFITSYELPEIAKVDAWYSDQLYKVAPTRTEAHAIGIEARSANGEPHFLVMRLMVFTSDGMQNWYYNFTALQADKAHFEKAKRQMIFALANMRYALEPIMAYNSREAEKAGRSWAEHNRRMAQNQAAFEAQQRAHINSTNAINESIMEGYRSRTEASDRNQEQFIDAITERTRVTNTETGREYKVDAGYNTYWMNADGEYISTDQYDYNPNRDDLMNHQNWQRLEQTKP